MGRVCFIILHYKAPEVTDRCVQSILTMEYQEKIEIVIIDNDIKECAEERAELLRKYRTVSNIHVVQIIENGGFSYANNVGYSFAREKLSASFILILNNDVEFTQKDFIEKLEFSYRQYPCHILGPDIVKGSSKEHQNPMDIRERTEAEVKYTLRMNRLALKCYSVLYPVLYLQTRYSEKRNIELKKQNEVFYSTVQKDVVPFGACLIFTPRFVEREEKAFDPETQFYYEEYILAHRCKRKQYEIVYDPSMCVVHESGAVTKKDFESERKRMRFQMERIIEACKIYLEYLTKNNS